MAKSLKETTQEERVRSEGKIDLALNTLARLESLSAALNEKRADLIESFAADEFSASVFNGLDSNESARFVALRDIVESQLESLLGRSESLESLLKHVPTLPFINWRETAGQSEHSLNPLKWVAWSQYSFNLKVAEIKTIDSTLVSVAELPVPIETVKSWNVKIHNTSIQQPAKTDLFQVRSLSRFGSGYHSRTKEERSEPAAYDVASNTLTLTRESLLVHLNKRELKCTDLLLQNGLWVPLIDSMEFGEVASGYKTREHLFENWFTYASLVGVMFLALLMFLPLYLKGSPSIKLPSWDFQPASTIRELSCAAELKNASMGNNIGVQESTQLKEAFHRVNMTALNSQQMYDLSRLNEDQLDLYLYGWFDANRDGFYEHFRTPSVDARLQLAIERIGPVELVHLYNCALTAFPKSQLSEDFLTRLKQLETINSASFADLDHTFDNLKNKRVEALEAFVKNHPYL